MMYSAPASVAQVTETQCTLTGTLSDPPFPFGRICFVVLVMRKGGESSWSGPWHLGCTLEVLISMCTATRTSSYSPVGPSVFYLA